MKLSSMIRTYEPLTKEPLVRLRDAEQVLRNVRLVHEQQLEEIAERGHVLYALLAIIACAAGVALIFI